MFLRSKLLQMGWFTISGSVSAEDVDVFCNTSFPKWRVLVSTDKDFAKLQRQTSL